MATSGSKTVQVTSWDDLVFSWSVTSQSASGNYSVISWTLKLVAGDYGRISSTASKSWSVTIDGTTKSGTNTIGIANNATKTLASGTQTIYHDSNGAKTFSYSFKQAFDITFSGTGIGTLTSSGSGTLPALTQRSTLTVSTGTLGTAQTMTINAGVTTLKHKITYEAGTGSGYVAGSASAYASGTSITWTPPLDLLNNYSGGNGTKIQVFLKLYTYDSIGQSLGVETKSVYYNVPDNEYTKPGCSISVTAIPANFGDDAFVKGITKLNIVLTPTITYGSAIQSYKTTVDGGTYTTASFITPELKSSGNITITAMVTNKRGFSRTVTKTIYVEDYTPVAIDKFIVERCTAGGTLDPEGEYMRATISTTASGNTPTVNHVCRELYYKKASESESAYVEVDLNSEVVKKTASGEVVRADDISSITHDVEVKVTCPDGVDPTSVTVTRSGKNLIKTYRYSSFNYQGISAVFLDDGAIVLDGTATENTYFDIVVHNKNSFPLAKGNYVFSVGSPLPSGCTSSAQEFANGSNQGGIMTISSPSSYGVVTTNHRIEKVHWYIAIPTGVTVNSFVIEPQIESGTVPTAFEKPNYQTVTPNADGTVDGITSVSPVTTIYSDTEGVTLEATYNMEHDDSELIYQITDAQYVLPVQDGANSYDVRFVFSDNYTSASRTVTVSTAFSLMEFNIDKKAVAIGKRIEESDLFDVGLQARFMGGQKPPVLEPETDLNDVRTPNTYTGENITNYNYANCPVTSGTFTLVVESGGESGQVIQTYKTVSKYKPEIYVRHYYQGEWGDWFWASTNEYVLYENSSGSGGTIALNASASHYRYIEIYFTDNNGKSGGYAKVYAPNGKTVCLQITEASATMYSRQTMYTISGTSMTPDVTNASYFRITSAGAVSTSIGTNYIRIIRVIGRA